MARNKEAVAIERWVKTHATDEEQALLDDIFKRKGDAAYRTKVLKLYCEWSLREFPWEWRY